MNAGGVERGSSIYKFNLFLPQPYLVHRSSVMASSSSMFRCYSPYNRNASSSILLPPPPPRVVEPYPTLASMMTPGVSLQSPAPPAVHSTPPVVVGCPVVRPPSSPTLTLRMELLPYLSAHPKKLGIAKAWCSTIWTRLFLWSWSWPRRQCKKTPALATSFIGSWLSFSG